MNDLKFCYLSCCSQTAPVTSGPHVELTEAMGFNVWFPILYSFSSLPVISLGSWNGGGQDKFMFEMDTKELGKELQIWAIWCFWRLNIRVHLNVEISFSVFLSVWLVSVAGCLSFSWKTQRVGAEVIWRITHSHIRCSHISWLMPALG